MSLIRLGETDKALTEAKSHLKDIDTLMQMPRPSRPDSTLRNDMSPSGAACLDIGYAAMLRNIVNALSAKPQLPADSFDPMLF